MYRGERSWQIGNAQKRAAWRKQREEKERIEEAMKEEEEKEVIRKRIREKMRETARAEMLKKNRSRAMPLGYLECQ